MKQNLFVITVILILSFALFIPVSAQLSKEDIEELKKRAIEENWTFEVGENSATNYSVEELCGTVEPDNWQETANFKSITTKIDLPAVFDWRDSSGLTPVKSQGGCGSCWAFATNAVLECKMAIDFYHAVDVSEQYLVSCDVSAAGCNGGWAAFDYYTSEYDNCGGVGAVLEADMPYQAADIPCDCPYDHHYLIDSYSYVVTNDGFPVIDNIKTAIIEHGPVWVLVYASNPAFSAYNGGIYNIDSDNGTNHAVVLVGWDDNQGAEGVWFLRNSWGENWGEDDGYMRIEYGCENIGFGAIFIEMSPNYYDIDQDGINNAYDNCVFDINLNQLNSDTDIWGDACDNCINDDNLYQEDEDEDGIGDICDECTDTDEDGYGNPGFVNTCPTDNCPDVYNPSQADANQDGIGDACDCVDPDTATWARTFYENFDQRGYSIKQTLDSGFIISGQNIIYGSNHHYLVKTNQCGNVLWTKSHTVPYVTGINRSVELTPDGGFVVVGEISEKFNPPFTGSYIYMVDSIGNILWDRIPGVINVSESYTYIQALGNDEYIVLGNISHEGPPGTVINLVKYSGDGTVLWEQVYDSAFCVGYCVQKTSNDGFIVTGNDDSEGIYLMKTDSQGNKIWARNYPSIGGMINIGYSVRQLSDDGYIISGEINWKKFFLFKVDSLGDSVWAKTYDNEFEEIYASAYSVEVTHNNGFIACGFENSGSYYIVRTDPNGDTLWTKYGGYGEDKGLYSLVKTYGGGYAFAGFDNGSTDNIFIEKIGPDENCCLLRGDVSNDGDVLIDDLLFIVDFVFKGGPPPDCFGEGDANDDGGINVADLSYLVNYLFKSGPAPPDC